VHLSFYFLTAAVGQKYGVAYFWGGTYIYTNSRYAIQEGDSGYEKKEGVTANDRLTLM
jgi:hypothetical protein